MSLMLPSNLSKGTGSLPKTAPLRHATVFEEHLDDTKVRGLARIDTEPNTAPELGQASPVIDREASGPETTTAKTKIPQKGGGQDYFDEEGTELGKDAKFWKVYVEETDRWDAEVIDSWNKSLDVILVFAALFSAISTAFLIESSKKLQQDPADTSAQSLVVISQTLLAMANNLPPPGPDTLPSNGIEAFTPTYNAIVINTLWYLSLSISLATAFLAALAKEWCQSFLTGRTGHPCIQARRRQQKWTMIENWRMEELITLLPTLIHIALLLFSIGLCFYVQELNTAVAIPVICVTGAAVGFYVISSLIACFLEFFPYKTIVSKMIESKMIRPWIIVARVLMDIVQLCLCLFIGLVYLTAGFFVGLCGSAVLGQYIKFGDYMLKWYSHLFNYPEKKREETPKHDHVTSDALRWMIHNCEVPNSIDITLQAIAGATQGLPLSPLQDCQAALKISQRLVSSNLHGDTKEHQRHMRLYVRALAVLTNARPQQESILGTSLVNTHLEHLKALIWELQAQNENSVASLMAGAQFIPSDHNISALRVGSMAASQCLAILEERHLGNRVVTAPFVQLFQQHLEQMQTYQIHPASTLALINTGSMLSAFSVSCDDVTLLPSKCVQTFCGQLLSMIGSNPTAPNTEFETQMPGVLIACCLLQNKHATGQNASIQDILSVLINIRSLELLDLRRFLAFGLLEIISDPESYAVGAAQMPNFEDTQERARLGSKDIAPDSFRYALNPDYFEALQSLTTLRSVHVLAQVGSPSAWAYLYVVTSLSRVRSRFLSTSVPGDITDHCGYLLSRFRFPKLSAEFIEGLERCNACTILKRKNTSNSANWLKHFFAASQLWLLYSLYLDPIPCTNGDEASLLGRLRTCFAARDDDEVDKSRYELGEKIEELSKSRTIEDSELGSFEVYYYRVLECVFQAKDLPTSDHRWEHIEQKLAGVPPVLRGLGSFIQLPMRSPATGAPPPPEHTAIDVPKIEEPQQTLDLETNIPILGSNSDPSGN